MKIFRRRRGNDRLAAGDRAMAARRWPEAAEHYRDVLARHPGNIAIWVQQGHAFKELGDAAAALRSYACAIELAPENLDARLHRAQLLWNGGRREDAIDAFVDICCIDPAHAEALAMIVQAGARDRLPVAVHRLASTAEIARIDDRIEALREQRRHLARAATYGLGHYDEFRHDLAIQPPPPAQFAPSIAVRIDARDTIPALLRATLLSLTEQSDADWTAAIVADSALETHPVASLAGDPRIRFSDETTEAGYIVHLSAGTVLDREAIAWFRFAAGRTGAAAAWCDFDHGVDHWQTGRRYERPEFWGVFDLALMAQSETPPPVIIVRNGDGAEAVAMAAETRRAALIAAAADGMVAHIPRILATVLRPQDGALAAPGGNDLIREQGSRPSPGPVAGTAIVLARSGDGRCVAVPGAASRERRINVIIPTRDGAAMLDAACTTLLSTAASPDRIDLTIVDNRSAEPETAVLLEGLRDNARATVIPFDEPFNWSRANNLALARSTADIVLFANNDIEMLTPGWDDLIAGYLDLDGVGALGCRLLYPDARLQHGGILLGLGDGFPIHDGARAAPGDTGPQSRHMLTHDVAAVTGAFLAARRETVEQVGGFDEARLAIAFNDIDFCLKVRATGLRVLYAPAIELIHHESVTRGFNDDAIKISWDLAELQTLHTRWGDAMLTDPGYNPHWSADRPFDGYRGPTMVEILDHLDLSARLDPWRVAPAAGDARPSDASARP